MEKIDPLRKEDIEVFLAELSDVELAAVPELLAWETGAREVAKRRKAERFRDAQRETVRKAIAGVLLVGKGVHEEPALRDLPLVLVVVPAVNTPKGRDVFVQQEKTLRDVAGVTVMRVDEGEFDHNGYIWMGVALPTVITVS